MSVANEMARLSALSVEERLELVQELWDSIAADQRAVPLSDEHRQELERRLAAYHRNPEEGEPWDEVEADLKGGE